MTTFSQEVQWTDRDGAVTRIASKDQPTLQKAKHEAREMAQALGWTAPKWWQWWRWGDTTAKHLAV
jgi:hypothetical protein